MLRLGRYDAFDKWEIVSRAWAGQPPSTDLGVDRHGRPLLAEWQGAAFHAGNRRNIEYVRLTIEAFTAGAYAEGPAGGDDPSEFNSALLRLLQEFGPDQFQSRAYRLIDSIREGSPKGPANDELPPVIADHLKDLFKFAALEGLRWTEDIGEVPDIEVLRFKARPFPLQALRGKRNVLSMFCAREYGVIDVIHIHDICPDHATLVDLDPVCLDVLKSIYPPEWTYICADYKEFLREAEQRDLRYDLIVADPWRAHCPEVGFDMFATIMGRCTDTIVIHYVQEMFDELGIAMDDIEGLTRGIVARTGVNVIVTQILDRGVDSCWVAMRKLSAS